jgi:hypothetical protein
MTIKEELNELYEFKIMVESRLFQKFLMEPLKKEIESLKNAYDCDEINELHFLKGKEKGLRYVIEILKQKDNDTRNKKTEVDNSDG